MRGHTSGTAAVRRILRAHAMSEATGMRVDEVLQGACDGSSSGRRVTRRQLLGGAAAVVGAGVGAAPAAAAPSAASGPVVAVVGAGLAGLQTAYWLWTVKGIRSTVYEADDARLGGRCWSLRGYFDGGYTVEHGGAFVNTDHTAIRNLVNRLGLSLYELNGGNQPPYGDIYWADGAPYSYDEANEDWGEVWRVFKDALAAAPYPQTAFASTDAGRTLDAMTVDEWIEANLPGGLAGRFGQIMRSNAIAEYGLDPGEQSALNLVYLLGWNGRSSLDPINGADERFGVVGGNDQIITRMAAALPPGSIRTDHVLVAAGRTSDGRARLTFETGHRYTDVVVDRAVLALPFTVLADVDTSGAGFSAAKRRAIQELGLGSNGKIHIQLNRRPWLAAGHGGVSYSPVEQFQCIWDDTVNQTASGESAIGPDSPGILCYFPGGSATLDGWSGKAFGPAPGGQVGQVLDWVDPVFPGTAAAYDGLAWRDAWHLNPWSRGAYTCPRPGQYTSLFGIPELPEGPFHFAGEHTSAYYFGFLNGAVESGRRAAKEVAG